MCKQKNCFTEKATSYGGLTTFDGGDNPKRSFDVNSSPSLEDNFSFSHKTPLNPILSPDKLTVDPKNHVTKERDISHRDKNRSSHFLSNTALAIMNKKNRREIDKSILYSELDKYLTPVDALLELYQKGTEIAFHRSNKIFTELYVIRGIINKYCTFDGKFNENVMYYYYSKMPLKIQRRFSYILNREEQKKISKKLKLFSGALIDAVNVNVDNDLEYNEDYTLKEAAKILNKTYIRISQCAKVEGVYTKADSTDVKIATNMYCNSRFCPRCAERRKIYYRNKYEVLFKKIKNPHMITLTVKNPKVFNKRVLKRFTDGIKKLWERGKPDYKGKRTFMENVHGFLRGVEVGLQKNGTYNLHAHLICEISEEYTKTTSYKNIHARIKEEWRNIMGDSYVVHIKKLDINSFSQAIKYIVKPQDLVKGSETQISSAILTLYRKHILLPYGSFRNDPDVKAFVEEYNNFNTQATYDDIADEQMEDLKEKEKLKINFVAYKWVSDGKEMQKSLRNNIKSVTGEDWVFSPKKYTKELQEQINDKVYGVGYEIA